MSYFSIKGMAAAALICGAGFVGHSASAATVSIYSDGGAPHSTERATLTCTECSVLIYTADATDSGGYLGANNVLEGTLPGDHGFSSVGSATDFGELFANSFDANPSGEADWFNSIMGTSITLTDADKTETVDGTYVSSASYVIVKVGRSPNYTILRNDDDGSDDGMFSFTWSGSSGGGAGLSHFTEVAAAIPVPAAGFMLIGGIGALAALRRRRKKT